jgi:hypothetical protein
VSIKSGVCVALIGVWLVNAGLEYGDSGGFTSRLSGEATVFISRVPREVLVRDNRKWSYRKSI